MACSQYEHLIQGYIDQTITENEKKELNEHVTECVSCRHELQEMVEVISFIEDIGEEHIQKVKHKARKFKTSLLATCMTVCSAVVLVFYNPMSGSILQLDERPGLQYRNIVLADESEQLPFPRQYERFSYVDRRRQPIPISLIPNDVDQTSDEYVDITWVYPSVYPHLDDVDFHELSDEYVFINIPDEETLHHLIAFLQRENLHVPIELTTFPASIVINRSDQEPLIHEFQFPTEVEQFHRFVDEIGFFH